MKTMQPSQMPYKYRKNILLLLLLLFITLLCTQCVLTKKQRRNFLAENCVVATTEKSNDSTSVTVKEKHDTTYISIPGPITYLPNPCQQLCDSLGQLKPFKQTSKKNGIKQTLQSVGNVLVQDCNVDSLLNVIKNMETTIHRQSTVEKETQVHENCKLEHTTDFDGFCRWFFYIVAPGILIYMVLKFWLKVPFL